MIARFLIFCIHTGKMRTSKELLTKNNKLINKNQVESTTNTNTKTPTLKLPRTEKQTIIDHMQKQNPTYQWKANNL